MLCWSILCQHIPLSISPCDAIACNTILCSAMQSFAVLWYSFMLRPRYTMQCFPVLCVTTLYYYHIQVASLFVDLWHCHAMVTFAILSTVHCVAEAFVFVKIFKVCIWITVCGDVNTTTIVQTGTRGASWWSMKRHWKDKVQLSRIHKARIGGQHHEFFRKNPSLYSIVR